MKILFACDLGLGDLIVSLSSLFELCRRLQLSPVFLVGEAQATYLALLPEISPSQIYTSPTHIQDLSEYCQFYSIRTSKPLLQQLKCLSKKHKIPLHVNPLHESFFAILLRRLFSRLHYADIPSFHGSSFLKQISILRSSPQASSYIVPPIESLIPRDTLFREFALSCPEYILFSPSGADPQRVLTYEQLSLFSSSFKLPIVFIGNNSKLDIPTNSNSVNLVGKTDLRQAISFIVHSSLAICMDSAFAHISSAYPTVRSLTIMGNASANRWGPLPSQVNCKLVHTNRSCSPCGKVSCKKFFGAYSCMQHPAFMTQVISSARSCLNA